MSSSPVIVVGMHRSGTSALVRSLTELGLFAGYDLEPNAEARYFLNLNEEMLAMTGARWDAPDSMLRVLQEPGLVNWFASWLDQRMSGFDTCLYLSKPGWWRYRDIRNYPKPWGWKDPRNTLMLPIWLKLFPEAKIIHVVRHAVDVAASLRVRERKLLKRTLMTEHIGSNWAVTSPRCLDLQHGFDLWEQYMSAGCTALAEVPGEQCFTLTFEDWLAQPLEYLHKLNEWLGLTADEEQVQKVSDSLRVERRFAFSQDEELLQFARTVCPKSEYMRKYYPEMVSI
ncbi:MAG: sulfotransferase [Mariprofundaceae bacterium]